MAMGIRHREMKRDLADRDAQIDDLQAQVRTHDRCITQLFGEGRAKGYDIEALRECSLEMSAQVNDLMERVQASRA